MPGEDTHLFISYARPDLERVNPVVEALRNALTVRDLGVAVWMDVSNLHPGEQWNIAIQDALRSSIGFVFFLSRRSIQSDWVREEIGAAARGSNRLIFPVLLDSDLEVPLGLAKFQWLDLSGNLTTEAINTAASQIAEATKLHVEESPKPRPLISPAEAPIRAAKMADDLRASEERTADTEHTSVFLVHGHNADVLADLEAYLASVGIAGVVLSRRSDSPQSLFQKFMSVAKKANFAIVILTPDDYGASRRQYDATGVADKALQFRPRQNVTLELGFFYGRLGWENVFVLMMEADRVFPNFELPSDLAGVVFDSISSKGWQEKLGQRLSNAGFRLREKAISSGLV